ncbi:FMN-binding protein [Carboxylicivirga sp. N1Y90]|uniref:FMN-binding protein n=1 Tax=Carboxylicivirga fragile TaxID=3417571 RepID=UPI003D3286EE|nr:FMN-binding protein [Marinilabiliaceae bacterium N1Y90]
MKRSNSILTYLTIALLLLAVAIRGGASFDWLFSSDEPVYTLTDIQKLHPSASTYKTQADGSTIIFDSNNKIIGNALISDELDAHHQGYAGDVPLLIGFNKNDNSIISTLLLSNNETGEFLHHVEDTKLLESWNGQKIDTCLLHHKLDAISGATKTSNAIMELLNLHGRFFRDIKTKIIS